MSVDIQKKSRIIKLYYGLERAFLKLSLETLWLVKTKDMKKVDTK